MIKLSILIIALFASISVQAAYVIKIPMDKEAVSFKQYYDNVGVDPNENNNSATDPSCEIKNGDFAPFSGQLLKVSKEENFKCVVDFIVPKSVFDAECNSNYLKANTELWDMMRSKGVDGVSSFGYYGECSA